MTQPPTTSATRETPTDSTAEGRGAEGSDSAVSALADDLVDTLRALDSVPSLPITQTRYRIDHGSVPDTDDPLNAYVRRIAIVGGGQGALEGTRISVKDSIAIAGIPMSCGSAALASFVPSGDASVVRRLIDAGALITAVTNMDDLAFAAAGETSVYGPTLNPYDHSRLAGGSSGGAAASLHYHHHEVAIGTDQGGSTRVPAAWCGVLGLKPTHGLIPYTGVAPMEPSLDHIGVLATSVAPLSAVLTTLAGPDDHDLRQHSYPASPRRGRRRDTLSDYRIRVLDHSRTFADPHVRTAFDRVIDRLERAGVIVDVTTWDPTTYGPITSGLFVEGMSHTLAGTHPDYGYPEYQWTEYTDAVRSGIEQHHSRLGPHIRATLQAADTLAQSPSNRPYSRALAARHKLRTDFLRILDGVDLVVEPAVPVLPIPVRPSTGSAVEIAQRGWSVLANTGKANIAGFPSMSLPLGSHEGLPVGVMATAAPWHEDTLIHFAAECEQKIGWNPHTEHPLPLGR